MQLKQAFWAAVFGASLATAGSAHAVVIDGINVPAVPDILFTTTVQEGLITAAHQTLQGIGRIDTIAEGLDPATYTYGQGGLYLTYGFTFTSTYVRPAGVNSTGYVEFTGGVADVYLHTSAPNLHTGSTATDYLNATTANGGVLWLGVTPATFATAPGVAPLGPTTTDLEAILPSNSSLTHYSNASGTTFLYATSGAAAGDFHTCSYTGLSVGAAFGCPAGAADMIFSEIFSTGSAGDWQVSGNAFVKAAIPEPLSVSLLGAGLVGLGLLRRPRR